MPIEIRELVIRATVDPGGNEPSEVCGAPKPDDKSKGAPAMNVGGGDQTIQHCVREVLRILAQKAER